MKLCMGCMNQIEDHLTKCPYCGFNESMLRQESYYLDPGTVVGGKYIVGRVLSYGGHTVSYLGMDAEFNRKVIVKEYLPSDFSTRSEGEKDVTIYSGDGQVQFEQGLTNFLNEMNHIQHLKDAPGIARVYDCLAENETGYVVSEYVEGKTLKEILESGKRYSAEEAAKFIKKILRGLSKVHKEDVIHCDISPETIMVTAAGDIKLMDFGATRYVTTANSKSLSIILKRGYAPEEQYRSKGSRGPWTDVYALGAVMYRMITGTVPQESVERTLADDLKEPSKMGISIPKNIENALMNALNVYQKERTPSAEIFLKELSSDNVKRIKVKQRKNKTGKFPVWAKALVAVLACVVIAGGGYVIHRMSGQSPDALDSKVIVMQDFRNKSKEDAEAYVKKLNEEHSDWDIRLNTDAFVFDRTKEHDSIASQSIEPGAVLYDPDKETQEEAAEGLSYDDKGNVSGELKLTLYSREAMHYRELQGLNAYALAKKLEIDTDDPKRFIEETEEKEGSNYFDLASLETGGQKITPEELSLEGKEENVIAYSPDMKIHYYASDFYYWEQLPDFAQWTDVTWIPEQPLYKYANEKNRKQTGTGSLADSNLIDRSYCALGSRGYHVGQIVGQNKEAGTEYDGSQPGEDLLKIYVIGKLFSYQGMSARKFIDQIGQDGFNKYGVALSSGETVPEKNYGWSIVSVEVNRKSDESKKLDYFSSQDNDVFFYIIVKEPEPPKPKSTQKQLPKKNQESEPAQPTPSAQPSAGQPENNQKPDRGGGSD